MLLKLLMALLALICGNQQVTAPPPPPDTVRPVVVLVSPTVSITNDSSVEIIVTATDNVELQKIVANIYQGGTLYKSTSSSVDGAADGTHLATVNLPDGSYTIRYNASDLAGNVSETSNHAIIIDTTNPRISDAKISEDIVNSTATPTLSATVDGTGSNVASAQYRIHTKDGSQVAGFSWVDMQAEDGYFDQAIEGITSPVSIAGLTDGEYIARIRAFDEAGNKKSGVDVGFTVDNTAPEVLSSTITNPTVDDEVFGAPGEVLLEATGVGSSVQWAIRANTCAPETNTLFGNVDGHNDLFEWIDGMFRAEITDLGIGKYCFVFNPSQGERAVRWFTVGDQTQLGECTGVDVTCDGNEVTSEPEEINNDEDPESEKGLQNLKTGVLGVSDGLANTGNQNIGLITLAALSAMGTALFAARRSRQN